MRIIWIKTNDESTYFFLLPQPVLNKLILLFLLNFLIMRLRPIIIALIFLIISLRVSAQFLETGQDPASLKWMQIKTDRFRVIYPEKYGARGIDFARSLEKAYSDFSAIFPEKKFKIPVIIHNFTTESNGYVSWAPKRMEIYPTPEQNSIPLDAHSQLALHELTHVMQMESLNTGFSKAMSFILGQQFPGGMAVLLPQWFMEGDAVFAESIFSNSGRGRSADFQKELKALAIENGHLYKYDKMINGSYRNYVPDHYQFGYQMVAWSMTNNDHQLWNNAMKFTANQPFTINPVNISLKRDAGLTKKTLFIQTFDSLKLRWQKDIEKGGAITYDPLNRIKKEKYVNYSSPVIAGKDSVIAIKTTLSQPPKFVLIKLSDKSEKKLHVPGQIYPLIFSYAHGNLLWVETHKDPRWENRNYLVIKIKNIWNGNTRQFTHKSRFMSVAISPDGKHIAATENTPDNQNNLVFFSTTDKSRLQSIPVPDNAYLQQPDWSADGSKIAFIFLTEAGEGVISYNLDSSTWTILVKAGRDNLRSAKIRNDSLFFISSISGTDNIYVQTKENIITPVTKSRFGVNDFNIIGSTVIFTDYSSSGNNICKASLDEIRGNKFISYEPVSYLIDQYKIKSGSRSDNSKTEYLPRPYRKWMHLFGIHSWMPFYPDIVEIFNSDPISLRPGVTVMSQNQLSTLIATIGYEYSKEKNHLLHSRIIWKGWYPVIESQFDYGISPILYKNPSDPNPAVWYKGYQFVNTISLPLTISSGKFSQYIYIAGTSNYRNDYLFNSETSTYNLGNMLLTGRLFFMNYYKSTMRDIFPKWGQGFDLYYTFAPFDKIIYGSDLSFKTVFYFPGFLRNNGIRIRYNKEILDYEKYIIMNTTPFPRSYYNIISTNLDFISIDYAAPLAYPDFNIASLFYLKRVRADFFYDYARGSGNYYLKSQTAYPDYTGVKLFQSFGIEIISDFYVLRLPFMISSGVRVACKNIYEVPSFEFLFNIDIYGMSVGRRSRM
jgi:hypothetical protein